MWENISNKNVLDKNEWCVETEILIRRGLASNIPKDLLDEDLRIIQYENCQISLSVNEKSNLGT